MTTIGEYTIDHDGIDGKWRASWRRPDGLLAERLFDTEQQAEDWVDFMMSFED